MPTPLTDWRRWLNLRFKGVPEWGYVAPEKSLDTAQVHLVALDYGNRSNILTHSWEFIVRAMDGEANHDRMLYVGVRDWLRGLRLFGFFVLPERGGPRRPQVAPEFAPATTPGWLNEIAVPAPVPRPRGTGGYVARMEREMALSGSAMALREAETFSLQEQLSASQRALLREEMARMPLYVAPLQASATWSIMDEFVAIDGPDAPDEGGTGLAPRSPPDDSGPPPG